MPRSKRGGRKRTRRRQSRKVELPGGYVVRQSTAGALRAGLREIARDDGVRAGKGSIKRRARQGARVVNGAPATSAAVGRADYGDLVPRPREIGGRDYVPAAAVREELDAGRKD